MNLAEMAKAALKDDYQRGNPWETMLARHLREHLPELVESLGKDLQNYLIVQTHDAQTLFRRLTDEGTNPFTAKELAMAQLFPIPADETTRV